MLYEQKKAERSNCFKRMARCSPMQATAKLVLLHVVLSAWTSVEQVAAAPLETPALPPSDTFEVKVDGEPAFVCE